MSNKVKRPMNAYMLFSKEKKAEIIQQNPELKSKVAEVAKILAFIFSLFIKYQKKGSKNWNVKHSQLISQFKKSGSSIFLKLKFTGISRFVL